MNQETRNQRRQQETKTARIAFIVILLVFLVLITGVVIAVRQVLKQNDGDDIPAASDTEVTEIQPEEEAPPEEPDPEPVQVLPKEDPLYDQAAELVAGMTLEEKTAQLFFITPDALTGFTGTNVAGDKTKSIYNEYPVGGLIYMSNNLHGRDQARSMLSKMNAISQERTGLPLLLSVDEEGGTVARIAGNSAFHVTDVGDMSAIGATGDTGKAYEAGSTIGGYLKDLGFNMNFAPVADVWTNPENTVISSRSFGSDSGLVAGMVTSELQGLSEQGIYGAVKHFPGQGGTAGDSHDGAVSLDKSLEELFAEELVPFQSAVDAGVQAIMVSHMSLPNVIGDATPASMSSVIMTDLLRGRMGYQGLILTDALNMGAITGNYTAEQAAVTAISAGADMVLMPQDFKAAYQGVLDAVNNGTLSEERINDAAAHVVKLKLLIQSGQ